MSLNLLYQGRMNFYSVYLKPLSNMTEHSGFELKYSKHISLFSLHRVNRANLIALSEFPQ